MGHHKKWNFDRNECYDYIESSIVPGVKNKSQAIEEYCQLVELPEHVVRVTYYNERKRRLAEDIGMPEDEIELEPEPDIPEPEKDPLETISEVFTLGGEAGIDMTKVLNGLLPLFEAARNEINHKQQLTSIEQLKQDTEVYKIHAEQAMSDKNKMEQELGIMRTQVLELNRVLEEFLNLASLQKVAGLSDFTYRLKIMVDKTGSVQSVEKVT